MLINWSILASNDLEDIVDYILVDNPSAALNLFETIKRRQKFEGRRQKVSRQNMVL